MRPHLILLRSIEEIGSCFVGRALHPPVRMLAYMVLLALVGGVYTSNACAAGPWRASANNTFGWKLMTPDERLQYQRRLRSVGSYAACTRYDAEHRRSMERIARQRHAKIETQAESACNQLRAFGRVD